MDILIKAMAKDEPLLRASLCDTGKGMNHEASRSPYIQYLEERLRNIQPITA